MRFDLERAEYTAVTVIIVVSVNAGATRHDFGVVVDGVSDVVSVDSSAVRPAPEIGTREATAFIRGLLPIGDKMVVLLDIDRLIGAELPALGSDTDEAAATAA
jgi:purine-binding chemotaxis protein CheW